VAGDRRSTDGGVLQKLEQGDIIMKSRARISRSWTVLVTVLGLAGWLGDSAHADDDDSRGAVFTLSNEAGGNQLVVFRRADNGALSLAGTVATGGLGSGGGLGSQGSLIFGRAHRALYAVNAGSNSLTVLPIRRQGPVAT
jgi:hypothetical protein